MIKPLLRVIPKLSGNVKLACNLFDFNEVKLGEKTVYEANIRYAKLLPLSSQIFQKKIDAGLLGSCWNFDLKKYYDVYSDIFYNNCFIFSKDALLQLDKTKYQYVKNTDMEYGVKRISYTKSGSQFAMFAPFYIDNVADIPSYFLLEIKLSNGFYNVYKYIKVNIANNGDSKYHYLYTYLRKYIEQIDDNVLFCQHDNNQGVYYGIDLRNGGFVKAIDNTVGNLYNVQNTIHNFDSIITRGFERNKIAMKQIIPLAFYFNVNDLLTPQERHLFKNKSVKFSGAYYTSDNKKLPFYDFSIDYDEFHEQILKMHPEYGSLTYQNGGVKNIMDVGFPSLNESRYINYQFANKLSIDFCRWKLKYSDDEHPYILNMSWAFSQNAGSNYRYGEFPVKFNQIEGLCNTIKFGESDYQYNLLFPFSNNRKDYENYNPNIVKEFEIITNQFCLNWFNTVPEIDDSIFANSQLWKDTQDDCVYYNGILYDLKNVYNTKENPEKVDKFAVLIKPDAHILTSSELNKLKFADYTLYRQSNSSIADYNVSANNDILYTHFNNKDNDKFSYLYYNEEFNPDKVETDHLESKEIYTRSSYGYFVDLTEIGIDYYEINKYYDYSVCYDAIKEAKKLKPKNTAIDSSLITYLFNEYDSFLKTACINGYLNIPIYKSKLISFDDDNNIYINVDGISDENLTNLKENLYYTSIDDSIHNFQLSYNSENSYFIAGKREYEDTLYGNNWYIKHKFIKSSDINKLIYTDFDSAYLKDYTEDQYYKNKLNDSWKFQNIANKVSSKAYALFEALNQYKKDIGEEILDYITTHSSSEFEFVPVSEINDKIYAIDTFKERTVNTTVTQNIYEGDTSYISKFYGSNIPEDKVNNDIDVIWADIYNLQRLYNKKGKTGISFNNDNSRNFFVKFLNKEHLYYYYLELFKDQNRNYKENYLMTDKTKKHNDTIYDYYDLTDETDREFELEISQNFDYWYNEDWYTTIYKKKKVWIYDDNYANHPVVRLVYENIGRQELFTDWFKSLNYNESEDLFYQTISKTQEDGTKIEEEEKFELVFTRQMFRVDKTLWDITDIENQNNNEYNDIYFYRLEQPEEYDNKYSNNLHIEFIGDINTKLANKIIKDPDTCLIPMFDNIFAQPESEAQIVVNYKLNNIRTCAIVNNKPKESNYNDLESKNELINYRYNKNDTRLMIKITEVERDAYFSTDDLKKKLWDVYKNTFNEFILDEKYNDLGYNDYKFNTYVDEKTGIKYGFYAIRSRFNNTSNSLKLTGVIDEKYDQPIYNLKYINVINGVNLNNLDEVTRKEYISAIYKQLSPFINLQPLNILNDINTIIYPKNYSINLRYSQYLNNSINGSSEVDIKRHDKVLKKLSLLRYMHNVTPLITKTNNIKNEYKLKLKNINASLLDNGKYNSIGDSCIYKEDSSININNPLKVYGLSSNDIEVKSYNNVIDEYIPLEFKHFNSSKFINLEEKIILSSNKKYKYNELLAAQSNGVTISLFKNYINRGQTNQYNDDEILFLINKYKIEYDSTPVGLTLNKSEKLYTLKYVFTLL